jgi:hypothetical protein
LKIHPAAADFAVGIASTPPRRVVETVQAAKLAAAGYRGVNVALAAYLACGDDDLSCAPMKLLVWIDRK